MSDFLTNFIGVNVNVLDLIKDYLTKPAIMVNLKDIENVLASNMTNAEIIDPVVIPSFPIPILIYPTVYTPHYEAQVSKQMLISTKGGKQVFTDNIAVQPTTWDITGYLVPFTNNALISQFPALAAVTGALMAPSLQLQKSFLLQAFKSRIPVEFRAMDSTISQFTGSLPKVGIVKLDFPEVAECRNLLPIQISLQEISVLESVLSGTGTSSVSTPIPGTDAGTTANLGNVAGSVKYDPSGLFRSSWGIQR